MARMFCRELAFEFLHRLRHVAVPEMKQAEQPMERNRTETSARLASFGRETGREVALGFAKRLSCDVDGRGHPVRERKIGQLRQGPVRGTETFLAPADERGAEMMPPVVWLERDRSFGRGGRVEAIARSIEHEPERCPGLAEQRIEPARLAGVFGGEG